MNRRNLLKSLAATPLLAVPVQAEAPLAPTPKPAPGLPEGLWKIRTAQWGYVDEDIDGESYHCKVRVPGASMTLDLGEIVNLRDNRNHGDMCGVMLPGCLFIEVYHEDFDGPREAWEKYRSRNGSPVAAVTRR
jgi:hypothetical protein